MDRYGVPGLRVTRLQIYRDTDALRATKLRAATYVKSRAYFINFLAGIIECVIVAVLDVSCSSPVG